MTNRKEIIALIPARSRSKGIPLKNITLVAGKPLINWVIEEAMESQFIQKIYVATDSEQIKDTINQYFQLKDNKLQIINRSDASATDDAPTEQVMLEFAEKYIFDYICLLQATSPLVSVKDIDGAIEAFFKQKADSLLTVVRQKRFLWEEKEPGFAEPKNYDFFKRPPRQELEGFLVENGALYVTSRQRLLQTSCRISGKVAFYEMPYYTYYELDEPDDLLIIENLLHLKKDKNKISVFGEKLKKIKLLALDVDGVLTDGAMYYSPNGEVMKKFDTYDGMGIERLQSTGVMTAIITKENSAIARKRAEKLKIKHIYTGILNKKACLLDLAKKLNIALDEIAYMGDDVNDIELLKIVGFSACPQNAITEAKKIVDYVCAKQGGEGAVRELCELILSQKNIIIK